MTIENLGNLTLRINGPDEQEYAHSDFDLYNIPYDGAVSLHFIAKINFDLTYKLLEDKSPYMTIIHNTGVELVTRNVDSFDVTVPSDGYYEIISLVIPTTTYIEDGLGYVPGSKVKSDLYTNIIAADISSGTIQFKILAHSLDLDEGYYSHIWTGWKDISLQEILDLLDSVTDPKETTVKKYNKPAFVIDNLYKCYISKAQDLFSVYSGDSGLCTEASLCKDSLNKYKTDIQIRDYLWMAINIINYCIQNCQYLKALKILNCVSSCSGICSDVLTITPKKSRGCGCSK